MMNNTTQTQNFKFGLFLTSWHWMTLIGHKVTKGLGGHLEISQTRFIPFHRLYFNLIRSLCSTKPAMTDNKNLTSDPTCDVISIFPTKFCNLFGKFKPGAIECSFRTDSWSGSLAYRKGALASRVREYAIGARVNEIFLINVPNALSTYERAC